MQEIQELLPNARVVYCSATGVSDTANMAYMGRLGLWGAGSLYPDFGSFSTTLNSRGMGAMEMLAGHLKVGIVHVCLCWLCCAMCVSMCVVCCTDDKYMCYAQIS